LDVLKTGFTISFLLPPVALTLISEAGFSYTPHTLSIHYLYTIYTPSPKEL